MHGTVAHIFFIMWLQQGRKETKLKKLDVTRVSCQGMELKNHISGYFSNLFSFEVLEPNQDVLSIIRRRVSDEMNSALLAPYSVKDVCKTLFNIGDLKAPDPNELYDIFYKRYWSMLGDDLVEEVLQDELWYHPTRVE